MNDKVKLYTSVREFTSMKHLEDEKCWKKEDFVKRTHESTPRPDLRREMTFIEGWCMFGFITFLLFGLAFMAWCGVMGYAWFTGTLS